MTARVRLVGVLAALIVWMAAAGPARAGPSQPPPPPTPPKCGPCSGPPPPPTPVPTLAPTVIPTPVVVEVHIAALKVKRGHSEKLTVDAPASDSVILVLRYRHAKPVTYRGKVGGSGSYVKSWKVPMTAPLGKAIVQIDVKSSISPYKGSVTFVVTQ